MSWGETIFLKKAIDGKKTFRSSDNPLVVLNSIPEKNWIHNENLGKFIPKTNGQVRLVANAINISRYSGFRVLENGVIIAFLSNSNENIIHSIANVTFDVIKGNEYEVVVYRDSGDAVITNSVSICADIVDGSLFDYTIGG